MNTDPTTLEIVRAMRKYGGSFASALGEAALYADESNLDKIKAVWPDYWEKYSELARIDKQRLYRCSPTK